MEAQKSERMIEPIHKSVTVNRPVAEAFELFTAGINRWWPVSTHSCNQERAKECATVEGETNRPSAYGDRRQTIARNQRRRQPCRHRAILWLSRGTPLSQTPRSTPRGRVRRLLAISSRHRAAQGARAHRA